MDGGQNYEVGLGQFFATMVQCLKVWSVTHILKKTMSWVHSPGCDVGNSLCQEILSLTGQTLSSRGRQETHSSVQTWFSQISQEKCDLSPFYGQNFPRSLPGRPEYEMRDTKSKIGRYQEDHGSELQEQNTSSPWTFLGLFRSYNVTSLLMCDLGGVWKGLIELP